MNNRATHVEDGSIPDYAGSVIEGVHLIDDVVYEDARGFFLESYNARRLQAQIDQSITFVQDNQSLSKQGVLRGLHYQFKHPQAKLVRILQGQIWDVVVDLRQSSASFGQWAAYSLSADRPQQLFIPIGCAHGFLTLSETALVMYKASDFYQPKDEYCLRYDDPHLAIDWPLAQLTQGWVQQESPMLLPILSAKDAQGLGWSELAFFK